MTALPEARLRSMEARRRRILDEAGRLLAAGGLEALNLRTLAENACVTVPTIYNLVGSKVQVVAGLIADTEHTIDEALAALPSLHGFARAEAAVRGHFTLCLSAPERFGALYRALAAVQAEAKTGDPPFQTVFRQATEVFCTSLREAAQSSDLHGRLLPMPLARHIIHGQVETFRLWSLGLLAPAATEARLLYSLHVALMADATKQGRRILLERLRASEARLDTK
jgi:AcrR family transcriptional regulator